MGSVGHPPLRLGRGKGTDGPGADCPPLRPLVEDSSTLQR